MTRRCSVRDLVNVVLRFEKKAWFLPYCSLLADLRYTGIRLRVHERDG